MRLSQFSDMGLSLNSFWGEAPTLSLKGIRFTPMEISQ